eukprot:TRINITY_DN5834_c0_g3_i6.p1 TRINITY_DN5834_c0_g3~~TRINITY_DN5834_c0_g3_i6.p1  ORF type:complete len:267 (+),score=38.10 TRINITY_DN5834_c0_g3_i6:426-1226(+)
MTGEIKNSTTIIPTIEGWWIGGKTKEKIYKHILKKEREKSRTKAQEILTSSRFWTDPSFYMIKSKRTVANVYKVTQAIMAGALLTKSRIYRLTRQGSILCDKCEEKVEETLYHALGECKAQEEQRRKLGDAVLKMLGKPILMKRWPIVIDQPTKEEKENGELMKGILAGGIPIEWKEALEKSYNKKALDTACRISALISKTITAIWGGRIGGERNDLAEYYNRRTCKMNLWIEATMDEHYNQLQIGWEALEEITEGTGVENPRTLR